MRWLFFGLIACLCSCSPRLSSKLYETNVIQANTPLGTHAIEGRASWYGPKFAGRKTANGEIFDPNQLTAAHKTLPFGTFVQVHNLENNMSVVVRINDRGPFKPGRIIDLSRAAAESINMISTGTAPVRIEPLLSNTPSHSLSARASALSPSAHQPTTQSTRLASDIQLSGLNIVSDRYPIGQLLLFSNSQETLMVRVSNNSMPLSSGVDFFVAPELLQRLGETVSAVPAY